MGQVVAAIMYGVVLSEKLAPKLYPNWEIESLPSQFKRHVGVALVRGAEDCDVLGFVVVCPRFAEDFKDAHDTESKPLSLDGIRRLPAYKKAAGKWGKFSAWCAERKIKLPVPGIYLAEVEVG
jgi:hypothetical protein